MFRIVPPLLLYLGACWILTRVGAIRGAPSQLLNGALYVCNVRLMDCGWYAAHTWSLAFEEQFYFIFPLLLLLRVRRRLSFALWAIAAVAAALPAFFFPLGWIGRTGFLVVYALFGLGFWFARHDRCWLRWRYPNVLFVAGAAATFAPWGELGAGRFALLVFIASVPVMVMAVAHPAFLLRRTFALPALALIGQASYSMYLWQQLFTGPAFASWSIGMNLAVVAAMVAGCVLLFVYVERPIIGYSRRLVRNRIDIPVSEEGNGGKGECIGDLHPVERGK